MKHHVCALLLGVSFLVCAESSIAHKSQRIGRFSHEDSFDENLVETVLKNSPAVIKKNVQNLLYPSDEDDVKQRLLLLGGTSNASTTAIAKAIALRCGYEYYVVEAAALLQEHREGRQMLLSEIRPIIKRGKPIALIITELPEMADYSGLLASTLWLLIDQCAQYPDVLVIATSQCNKGQLSEEVKERFQENIISVSLDKFAQKNIENIELEKIGWLERHKKECIVGGVLACFSLAVAHVAIQTWFAMLQADMQREQYRVQLQQGITQISLYSNVRSLYNAFVDGVLGAKEEVKQQRRQWDKINDEEKECMQRKLRELK